MIDKKTIKEIVDHIIDLGYEEGGDAVLVIDGDKWTIGAEPQKDKFNFLIPTYNSEPFVEDKKMMLLLDLSQEHNDWLRASKQREGGKKAAETNKKKGKEYFQQLAKKRWAKKKV